MPKHTKAARELLDFTSRVTRRRDNAEAAQRKTRIKQKVEKAGSDAGAALQIIADSDLPVDDGIAPAAPVGVEAVRDPATGQTRVEFNPANTSSPDYVRKAWVEYRKFGDTIWVRLEADPTVGTGALPLTGIATDADRIEARVWFEDAFGVISPVTYAAQVDQTYIPYLKVDSLLGGRLRAENIILEGTRNPDGTDGSAAFLTMTEQAMMRFRDAAGIDKIKLSEKGMEMEPVLVEGSRPADAEVIGQSISVLDANGNAFASLWGSRISGGVRGFQLRSDGVAGSPNVDGMLNFVVTRGGTQNVGDAGYARMRVTAEDFPPEAGNVVGLTGVEVRNALRVIGPIRSAASIEAAGAITTTGTNNVNAGGAVVAGGNIKALGQFHGDGTRATFGGDIRMGATIGRPAEADTLISVSPFQVGQAATPRALEVWGALTVRGGFAGSNIDADSVQLGKMTPEARDPAQSISGLRTVGSKWGGTSRFVSANDHAHSISFKELPPRFRSMLLAARGALYQSFKPRTSTDTFSRQEMERVKRLLAVCLHLLMDDPDAKAADRESRIRDDAGYRQKWYERFPEEPQGDPTYESTHDALRFLDSEGA